MLRLVTMLSVVILASVMLSGCDLVIPMLVKAGIIESEAWVVKVAAVVIAITVIVGIILNHDRES